MPEPIYRMLCEALNRSPNIVYAYVYDVSTGDGCQVVKTGRAEDEPSPLDYLASMIITEKLGLQGEMYTRTGIGKYRRPDGKTVAYKYVTAWYGGLLVNSSTIYLVGRINTTLFLIVWEALI